MRTFRFFSIETLKSYWFYISFILGVIFGLFVYSYWLIDVFPPMSRRIFLVAFLFGFMGWIGYHHLLVQWLLPQVKRISIFSRGLLICWSLLAGIIFLLVCTSAWQSSNRLIFLLPSQSLRFQALPSQEAKNITIFEFSDALGNLSLDTISYQGWEKQGDFLVLRDSTNNTISWNGRTGDKVLIVLRKSPSGGKVSISWNNNEPDVISLLSDKDGRYVYTHSFDTPFYASRWVVLGLGVLNFSLVLCAVSLLAWRKHSTIFLQGSIVPILFPTEKAIIWKWNLDWIVLAISFGLAVLLRIFNLDVTFPHVDEYNHLIAAKVLIRGEPLSSIYQRSLFIVTIPVAFFFRTFGVHLWSARLPGVLFNAIAIVPLYFATRRINRFAGFLSVFLYATSPWIIAVARVVREYAYYPFFFYSILYIMIQFIVEFPNGFVVTRDWRRLLSPRLFLLAIFLLSPAVYALFLDPSSTFKVILIGYIPFIYVLLGKFDLGNKTNRLSLALVSVIILLGGYTFLLGTRNIAFPVHLNSSVLRYFWGSPEQQWYFGRPSVLPMFVILSALLLSIYYRHSNFVPFYIFGLFFVYFVFFLFLFNLHIFPRYLISLELWYCVVMASGYFYIWYLLRSRLGRLGANLAVLILFLLTINPRQIWFPTVFKNGFMPITEEYHDDIGLVQSYLLNQVRQKDVLIASYYRLYVYFVGEPKFSAIHSYNSGDKYGRDAVLSIVKQNDSGWITISTPLWADSQPLPFSRVVTQNKEVVYIGQFADQYLWHWITIAPP